MNLKEVNKQFYLSWKAQAEQEKPRYKKEGKEKRLGIMVSDKEINNIEQIIQNTLPNDFKSFYKNYGSFLPENDNFYSVDFSILKEDWIFFAYLSQFSSLFSLVEYTQELWKGNLIPKSFFVIDEQHIGESCYTYLLMGIDDDNRGKVFLWPRRVFYEKTDNEYYGDAYSPEWGIEPNNFMIPVASSFTEFISIIKTHEDMEKEHPGFEESEEAYQLLELLFNFDISMLELDL